MFDPIRTCIIPRLQQRSLKQSLTCISKSVNLLTLGSSLSIPSKTIFSSLFSLQCQHLPINTTQLHRITHSNTHNPNPNPLFSAKASSTILCPNDNSHAPSRHPLQPPHRPPILHLLHQSHHGHLQQTLEAPSNPKTPGKRPVPSGWVREPNGAPIDLEDVKD